MSGPTTHHGETDATKGHSLEEESMDVVAVIQSFSELVFLLGRSYGAQIALAVGNRMRLNISEQTRAAPSRALLLLPTSPALHSVSFPPY
jgi:hypothetical protein